MTYVFIHGLGQTSSSWDRVIAQLPPDIPTERPCLPDMVKDKPITYANLYKAFETECNRMEMPLCLCGISLGAILAFQYALSNPKKIKSCVFIAPQYQMPKLLLDIQNMVFRILPPSAFDSMGFSKRDVIALTTSMKKIDFSPLLSKITCPAFIICGQKDRTNQKAARTLANVIPNAKLSLVEGAGHEVNTDAPAALAGLIKKAWFPEQARTKP